MLEYWRPECILRCISICGELMKSDSDNTGLFTSFVLKRTCQRSFESPSFEFIHCLVSFIRCELTVNLCLTHNAPMSSTSVQFFQVSKNTYLNPALIHSWGPSIWLSYNAQSTPQSVLSSPKSNTYLLPQVMAKLAQTRAHPPCRKNWKQILHLRAPAQLQALADLLELGSSVQWEGSVLGE
jgi:hypothetical protein